MQITDYVVPDTAIKVGQSLSAHLAYEISNAHRRILIIGTKLEQVTVSWTSWSLGYLDLLSKI